MNEPASASENPSNPATPLPQLAVRSAVGGSLMGLANLVPGISGGTMLLAAGVYPRFIAAIGEVSRFKLRRPSLVVLGVVVAAALASIVLLAGPVKELVVNHRWVMYSLFIGLTLGGVPVVWRLIRARDVDSDGVADASGAAGDRTPASVWIGAAAGFVGMAALALWQTSGGGGDVQRDGFLMLFLAGVAGASAMILPGVSGGYLLLVLGVYVPILSGISVFKEAIKAKDVAAITDVGLHVILPVGLGVVIGVVVVSNVLAWLLNRYRRATLGVLLGLLVGAVVGLWPFQAPVNAEAGMSLKGQTLVEGTDEDTGEPALVYDATGKTLEAEDLPTAFFRPAGFQIGGAVMLLGVGLGVTLLIDRLGRERA